MKKLIILVVIFMTSCGSGKSLYVKEGQKAHRKEIAHRVGKYVSTVTFVGMGVVLIVIDQRGD